MKAPALVLVLASGAATAGTFPLSQIRVTPRVEDGERDVLAQRWPCAIDAETVPPEWVSGGGDALYLRPIAPAVLERSAGEERVVVSAHGAELQRRADGIVGHVPLRVVAHVTAGIDVYAYALRPSGPPPAESVVYLLASFPEGESSFAVEVASGGESTITGASRGVACGLLGTELIVDHGNSRVGELQGTLPDGRNFLISASVSKTSRDGEPVLSVVARAVDGF
jgi:hypothetical protein